MTTAVRNERLTTFAAVIVICVWVMTTVYGMLTRDWEGLQIVTPIMIALAGYLFGRDFILSRRKELKNDNTPVD